MVLKWLLIHEAVADQADQGHEAVAPGNFFALGKIPSVIGNRNLEKLAAAFENLGGHLRLKVETVGTQPERTDQVSLEGLVAGFHVGQNGVVKNVGDRGQ